MTRRDERYGLVVEALEVSARLARLSLEFLNGSSELAPSPESTSADAPDCPTGGETNPAPPPPHFEPPMPGPDPQFLWLSPFEEAILRVADATWRSAKELVRMAGLQWESDMAAWMRNMVNRNMLEAKQGHGFRAVQPQPANSQ